MSRAADPASSVRSSPDVRWMLSEGARNLEDYFQSQGFYEADVQFKQQRVIGDHGTIDYLINTGARHKLVYIEIGGNHYFGTDAIRERINSLATELRQLNTDQAKQFITQLDDLTKRLDQITARIK